MHHIPTPHTYPHQQAGKDYQAECAPKCLTIIHNGIMSLFAAKSSNAAIHNKIFTFKPFCSALAVLYIVCTEISVGEIVFNPCPHRTTT